MLSIWKQFSASSSPPKNSAESSGASQAATDNDSPSGELPLAQTVWVSCNADVMKADY